MGQGVRGDARLTVVFLQRSEVVQICARCFPQERHSSGTSRGIDRGRPGLHKEEACL